MCLGVRIFHLGAGQAPPIQASGRILSCEETDSSWFSPRRNYYPTPGWPETKIGGYTASKGVPAQTVLRETQPPH